VLRATAQALQHALRLEMHVVNACYAFSCCGIDFEPHFPVAARQMGDAFQHAGPVKQAAVGDQAQFDLPEQPGIAQDRFHQCNGFCKLAGTGWLAIAREGDVLEAARVCGNVQLHEVAMQYVGQQLPQFPFKLLQVDGRRRSARQFRYLAVDAAPVACIVRIEVDADGNAARTPGEHRVNVSHARAVTVVVGDFERK